jgi:hypothetical protein
MTEATWVESVDPFQMLTFLKGKVSDRKLRLFAVACVRRVLSSARVRKHYTFLRGETQIELDVAEQVADGLLDEQKLVAVRHSRTWTFLSYTTEPVAYDAAWVSTRQAAEYFGAAFPPADRCPSGNRFYGPKNWRPQKRAEARESEQQCCLLRCMIKNPFRATPILNPAWLAWNDQTVVRIAEAVYDERAFARMPILADALEDAGCDNTDILNHCRGPNVHMRGCWVVDLILGKQ